MTNPDFKINDLSSSQQCLKRYSKQLCTFLHLVVQDKVRSFWKQKGVPFFSTNNLIDT